jgi:hypothetical protein
MSKRILLDRNKELLLTLKDLLSWWVHDEMEIN